MNTPLVLMLFTITSSKLVLKSIALQQNLILVVDSYLMRYYLYTSDNPNNFVTVSSENASKYIKGEYQTQFFIHGWESDRSVSWYPDLKNAFFSRDKYNIIEVDWSEIAMQPYDTAVAGTPKIGQNIGTFILSLRKEGIPLRNIRIVGHSLGAQISGYVGRYIYDQTSEKLARITALDPAGPSFTKPPYLASYRLHKNNADIVFVVHTDRTAFGVFEDCGTIDVFPNGGAGPQPGCPLFLAIPCSHRRSYELFVSAVANPGSLLAVKCNNFDEFVIGQCKNSEIIDLGDFTSKDKGRFYLTTTSQAPFRSLIP